MLVMVMEMCESNFIYRVLFVRGSSKKTHHEGGSDQKANYQDVWRLAPRDELIKKRVITIIYVGQTLRFLYGLKVKIDPIVVSVQTSRTICGTIECGVNRGETGVFKKFDITEHHEDFGTSILQDLLKQVKNLRWIKDVHSTTGELPARRPKFNPEFSFQSDEQY